MTGINRLEGYYLPADSEIYPDNLLDLVYSLPKDNKNYKWSVNYIQLAKISMLRDNQGELFLKYTFWGKYLFGIPVVIDNLNEPVSLQPVNE